MVIGRPLQMLHVDGVPNATVDRWHWEMRSHPAIGQSGDTLRGVPATGYWVEHEGRRF